MHVVCEHCAERIFVPEDKIHGRRARLRCSRCGGAMIVALPKDGAPDTFRNSMDTPPVDLRSIARLSRGDGAEVDSLLDASQEADVDALLEASRTDGEERPGEVSALVLRAVSGSREEEAPEVSAMFELKPSPPIPLTAARPVQHSIPFVLVPGELPAPRPPQPTIAFELRRPSEPSRSPRPGRLRWLGLLVVLVVALVGFLLRGHLAQLL